jgi:hypothetical protein
LDVAALIPKTNATNFQSPEKKSSIGQIVLFESLYPFVFNCSSSCENLADTIDKEL